MNVPAVMAFLYLGLPAIHMICTFILLKVVKREGDGE